MFIACVVILFCLTACGCSDLKKSQEINDTSKPESTISESQAEIQNDINRSDKYTKITSNIDNNDDAGEKVGMKLYINDTEVPVSWEDNDTIAELVEQAKLRRS